MAKQPRFLPVGSLRIDAAGTVIETRFTASGPGQSVPESGTSLPEVWPDLAQRFLLSAEMADAQQVPSRIVHVVGLGEQAIRIRPPAEDGSIEVHIGLPQVDWDMVGHVDVYRLVAQNTRDAIQVWAQQPGSGAMHVVFVNGAWERLTGYAQDDVVGRTPHFLTATGAEAETMATLQRCIDATEAFQGEIVHQRRDGTHYHVEIDGVPVLEEGDERIHWVTVQRDVAERVERDRRRSLQTRLDDLGRVAGSVAHAFNNTVASAVTGVGVARDLIRTALPGPEGVVVQQLLGDVEARLLAAGPFANRLITFAGSGTPVVRPVKLGRVLPVWVARTVSDEGVTCKLDVADGLDDVLGDRGQLAQVFANLVQNAITAMDGRGSLTVVAQNAATAPQGTHPEPCARYAVLSIADTGRGIPQDALRRVFEPYFTTDSDRLGLGLAITYSIIRRHGGDITVQSARGEGATFTLVLPAQEAVSPATRALAAGDDGPRRVLIMDDEPFLRRMLQKLLTSRGFEVTTACHGMEAVDSYIDAASQGKRFHLVLMDANVPGYAGGEAAMLALHQHDPGVRAVIMSAYASSPVMARHRELGFLDALPKPFANDELIALVERLAR